MTMPKVFNNRMRFLTAFTAFIALIAAVADAQPLPKDLVKATLVADVKTVKAGRPFTVGVLLKIKPHWHVYWKNPGDSGAPPRVTWNLPPGFNAGELRFPIPVRFDQPGDMVGYGYNEELLLTTTITPPNDLAPGKAIVMSANVSWLVCEDVCIPGKADLKLELPVGDATTPDNAELFAKWQAQLPNTLDHAKAAIKTTDLKTSKDGFSAMIEWSKPVKNIRWFPLPPEESGVENAQTASEGNVSSFQFALSPPPPDSSDMTFLVAYTDEQDKQQGVEFTVKLPPKK